MYLRQHLIRQIVFSKNTFGPSERTKGVSDHINKELKEIASEVQPEYRAEEWVDVVILGFDGLWRAIAAAFPSGSPADWAMTACQMIEGKQIENEARDWPDWRAQSEDRAIEHVREDK